MNFEKIIDIKKKFAEARSAGQTYVQIFNNYAQLCKFLEVKPMSGNSKPAHLKKLKGYFDYDVAGRRFYIRGVKTTSIRFLIDEIVSSQGIDLSLNGQSAHSDIVQRLIVDMLIKSYVTSVRKHSQKMVVTSITKMRLCEELGLVNSNHRHFYKSNAMLSSYIQCKFGIASDFMKMLHRSVTRLVDSSIEELCSQNIICASTDVRVSVIDHSIEDEDGKEVIVSGEHRCATDYELKTIGHIESVLAKRMGYDDKFQAYRGKFNKKYRNEVTKELKNRLNIEYYYTMYNLKLHNVTTNYISDNYSDTNEIKMTDDNRDNAILELNSSFADKQRKNVKARANGNPSKNEYLKELRALPEYESYQLKMCDIVLDMGADPITIEELAEAIKENKNK